ncbi:MAG: cytochrome c oxidase assembly protein [Wenzhouxiangella sp.]
MSNNDNRSGTTLKTAGSLTLMALAMFGFGYLLVPLYDKFCEITGIGGRTGDAVVEATLTGEVDTSRLVTVHFDSNVNSALPWDFEPTERMMQVHPGKLYETMYIAHNRSNQPIVAQAVPSVAPGRASLFFNKTECFCFTEQLLEPGESRDMPVRFVVDPNLPARTDLVTLSYIIYKNDAATAVLAAVDG